MSLRSVPDPKVTEVGSVFTGKVMYEELDEYIYRMRISRKKGLAFARTVNPGNCLGHMHRGLEQVQAGLHLSTPCDDLSLLGGEHLHSDLPLEAKGLLVPEANEARQSGYRALGP